MYLNINKIQRSIRPDNQPEKIFFLGLKYFCTTFAATFRTLESVNVG